MSRLNAKAAFSALLLALMIAAPVIIGLQAFTAQALTNVNFQLIPSKVVKGQDIIFWVRQTSGAFSAGAPIYFEISQDGSWAGDGYYLLSLKPGTTTLPPGTLIYVPSTASFYPQTTGTYWVLLSDSADGSTGVAGTQFTVEPGQAPVISINGQTYTPNNQVGISYTQGSATAPTVTPTIGNMPQATPGDTLTINGALFRGSTATIYFLYIYSNSWGEGFQMTPVTLATVPISDGTFSANVRIPNAPEGVHAILVVDNKGYFAFSFIYIYPTITVSPFSIRGEIGDTITVTGVGFPANAKISEVKLVTTLSGSELGTTILSGGAVDSLGRVTFRARLDVPVPANERGLLNLKVAYDPTAPGQDFQQDPDSDTSADVFKYVLAASTPQFPGDEAIVLPEGLSATSSSLTKKVGDFIEVVAVNFPANALLDVYFGPVKVGTIRTDANGAGSTWIQVPELPGYYENGTQIDYYIRVKDPATKLMATGIPYSTTYRQWTVYIQPLIEIIYSGIGQGNSYVLPGTTITVVGTGLAAFDEVTITETIAGATFNVIEYAWVYGTSVVEGQVKGFNVVATAKGTFRVEYSAAYDTIEYSILHSAPVTGNDVTVTVTAASGAVNQTAYNEVAAPSLKVVTLSDKGYLSGKPGDRITIEVIGLVPSGTAPSEIVTYKLYFDGASVKMYNPTTSAILPYITASSPTDIIDVDIYVPNVPTGPKVISLRASYAPTVDAAATWFIVSNPQTAATGTARIEILPGYETVYSGTNEVMIAGWNFEVDESDKYPVYLGISGVGEGLVSVDKNGAFIVNVTDVLGIGSLEVPQGIYAVYVRRNTTAFAPVPTVELTVKPNIMLRAGSYVHIGDVVTLDAYGLDPNKVYELRWSTDPSTPGYSMGVSFTTNGKGTKTGVAVKIPFGLPYNYYYIQVVPADSPDTIIATFRVFLLPTESFDIAGYRNYFVPLEHVGLRLYDASIYLSGALGVSVDDLIANGTVIVRFSQVGGSEVADVAATVTYNSMYDVLCISAPVPNFNETGLYGVSVRIIVPFNGSVRDTGWVDVAGIIVGDTGGILVNIGGVMQDLAEIKTDLGTVLVRLSDINATLVSVADGVATLQTAMGEVKADLETLKGMLSNVNATLVEKSGELMARLDTGFTTIEARLDALASLINGGFAEINGSLATIQTQLGEVSMSVEDLRTLIQATGDEVELAITDASEALATLIVEKSGEVVANITAELSDLRPLITSLNGTLAELQTTLGTVNAALDELLQGQAEIKNITVTKAGEIIATIESAAGEFNATLSAALDMINTGIVNTHRDLIDRLVSLRTFVASTSTELAAKLDQVIAGLSAANSTLATITGKIDSLSTAVAAISDNVNSLNGKMDAISAKTNDIAGKVVQIQSDVADVKSTVSDLKNTVDQLPGQISNVGSSVQSVGSKVDEVSSKLDSVKGRTTALEATTLVLVLITLILSALGLRRPE
ncbi:hypothetical protein [Stetteria hydrogenophila]